MPTVSVASQRSVRSRRRRPVLLYTSARVLLTQRFRYPVYVNDHQNGMLIKTAAGCYDDDDRRRRSDGGVGETACRSSELETTSTTFYVRPSSVTECVHFFAAPYDAFANRSGRATRARRRGIDDLRIDFDKSARDVRDASIQDAKAIMLLHLGGDQRPFAVRAAPGEIKPPRTRRSLVTLATFPSWGSWPGCRLAES